MKCLYCGKPLSVLQRLAGNTFCGVAHRNAYSREDKLALARLMESRSVPVSRETRRAADPENTDLGAEARTPWAGSLPLCIDPCRGMLPVRVDDLAPAPHPGGLSAPMTTPKGAAVSLFIRCSLPIGRRAPVDPAPAHGVLAASRRAIAEKRPAPESVPAAVRPQAGLGIVSLAGLRSAGLILLEPAAAPRRAVASVASGKGVCVWTVRRVDLRAAVAELRPPSLVGELLVSGLPAMAATHRGGGRRRATREPEAVRTPAKGNLCLPVMGDPGSLSAFGSGRLAGLTDLTPRCPGLSAFRCSVCVLPKETAPSAVFPVSIPKRKPGGAHRVRPWQRLLGVGIGARDFPCSPRFLPASREFQSASATEQTQPLPVRPKTPSKRPRVQAIAQSGRRIPA